MNFQELLKECLWAINKAKTGDNPGLYYHYQKRISLKMDPKELETYEENDYRINCQIINLLDDDYSTLYALNNKALTNYEISIIQNISNYLL